MNIPRLFFVKAECLAVNLVAVFAIVLTACGAAAEPVTIARDTPLYADPSTASKIVAQLKQGTPGESMGKQNGMLNVSTTAGTGWLYIYNVTFGAAPAAGKPSAGAPGGWNPFARAPASSTSPAVIGIRGFDEATIGSAMGDGAPVSAAQLARLDGYKAEKPDAAAFASARSLQAVKIDY